MESIPYPLTYVYNEYKLKGPHPYGHTHGCCWRRGMKKLIDIEFVEEEIVIDVNYVNAGAERRMLIDSSAPKSIVIHEGCKGQ